MKNYNKSLDCVKIVFADKYLNTKKALASGVGLGRKLFEFSPKWQSGKNIKLFASKKSYL